MKKITIIALFIGIITIGLILIIFIGNRNNSFEGARHFDEVLSKVEIAPTDVSAIESNFREIGMNLIEYTAVNANTNEVIASKTSGRKKMKGILPHLYETYGWSISTYTYYGSEGVFPVYVSEKDYVMSGTTLKITVILADMKK